MEAIKMEEKTQGLAFRATSEQWEGIGKEYSASGKSIRGFCRERGIPVSQMAYHLRRMRKSRREHGFIELAQEMATGNLWVEAGNCRIQVRRGFDAVLLRQVAEALS